MPIYSIIIPHKNCPDLLEKCVASIPERDDIQIIVVDDNSDEGKKPVINRPGVEVVLLDAESTRGAGRARNIGLDKATGKWLLFSDSDDTFETDNLNRMLDKYLDSEADIIFFNANRVDESTGKVLSQHLSKAEYDSDPAKYLNYLRYWSNVPWSKFIKRDIIFKHSIRFSEVPSANDLFFSTVSGFYAKEVRVDFSVIYKYSVRKTGSITSRFTEESIISRLSEASKRNEFLWNKGVKDWCTNLYVSFCEKLREIGYSRVEALSIIRQFITVGPKQKWLVIYTIKEPLIHLTKTIKKNIKWYKAR